MTHFRLREGMVLGVAAAATQIEGGEQDNSWHDWAQRGKIKDGTSPSRADDHYERWREDALLMKEMGICAYRLSLEWSRIEPENGQFDDAALQHYRDELVLLRGLGIMPLLTLHHFTNPMWFERLGAFSKVGNIDIFLRYAERVIRSLGDLVDEYVTINEPNVYAVFGYFFGSWPPGRKSLPATFKVLSHLAACHIRTYELIHKIRRELGYSLTRVGFAHHVRIFDPWNPNNPLHRFSARLAGRCFQDIVAEAFFAGRYHWPLIRCLDIVPGSYCDFIGINYYSRSLVSCLTERVASGLPVNDLGWEIYPEGLIRCARSLHESYGLPVYITENGTCDEKDDFRSRFICEHIQALCESGLPVERYYHWCFCDNFEWLDGESTRFGLVHVDFATQQRTIKNSGRFYAAIIADGCVSDAAYAAAAAQIYPVASGPVQIHLQ